MDPGFVSSAKSSHHEVIINALIHCNTSFAEVNCSRTPCRVRSRWQPPLPVLSVWSFIFIASFVLVTFISLVMFSFTLSHTEDNFLIKISVDIANSSFDIVFDIIYSYLTCLPVRKICFGSGFDLLHMYI